MMRAARARVRALEAMTARAVILDETSALTEKEYAGALRHFQRAHLKSRNRTAPPERGPHIVRCEWLSDGQRKRWRYDQRVLAGRADRTFGYNVVLSDGQRAYAYRARSADMRVLPVGKAQTYGVTPYGCPLPWFIVPETMLRSPGFVPSGRPPVLMRREIVNGERCWHLRWEMRVKVPGHGSRPWATDVWLAIDKGMAVKRHEFSGAGRVPWESRYGTFCNRLTVLDHKKLPGGLWLPIRCEWRGGWTNEKGEMVFGRPQTWTIVNLRIGEPPDEQALTPQYPMGYYVGDYTVNRAYKIPDRWGAKMVLMRATPKRWWPRLFGEETRPLP